MRNLVPWFEPPNETWNNGFNVTAYSYLMEDERIGSSPNFDVHNWYGRAASKLFKAVSAVYSNDRTLYNAVVGIQLYSVASGSTLRRFNSDRYVSETGDAGDAAKLWATHFAPAAYVQSGYYGTATETTMATEWASASAARKTELEDQYISYEDDAANALAWDGVTLRIDAWTTYGASVSLTQCQYEGNFETNPFATTGDLGNFRNAAKRSSQTYQLTQKHYDYFVSKGIVYPSLFDFCGQGTWSALIPSIYDTGSYIWDAIIDWNLDDTAPITGGWIDPKAIEENENRKKRLKKNELALEQTIRLAHQRLSGKVTEPEILKQEASPQKLAIHAEKLAAQLVEKSKDSAKQRTRNKEIIKDLQRQAAAIMQEEEEAIVMLLH